MKRHRKKKNQVLGSDILKWVMKNQGNAYPLRFADEVVDDVTGKGCVFDECEWCSMTKADLGRFLKVASNQVTRWTQAGLPELSDGRIAIWQAEAWLKRERPDWCAARDLNEAQNVLERLAAL